jgi:hypothetical protein
MIKKKKKPKVVLGKPHEVTTHEILDTNLIKLKFKPINY